MDFKYKTRKSAVKHLAPRITGLFTCASYAGDAAGRRLGLHNVSAYPSFYGKAGSQTSGKPLRGLCSVPTAHSRHSLPALEMLRISLCGPPNRRKQPER